MKKVSFIETTSDHLKDISLKPGRFIFTNDKHNLYLDLESTRITIGGANIIDTLATPPDWNETNPNSISYIKNKPIAMPASDVSDWAKEDIKPSYTAAEVGADPAGAAQIVKSDLINDLSIHINNTVPRLGAATKNISHGDWNSAIENGWYAACDMLNAPVEGWLYGEVIALNSIWIRQILYRFAAGSSDIADSANDRYERVCYEGTWGNWKNTSATNKTTFSVSGDTLVITTN